MKEELDKRIWVFLDKDTHRQLKVRAAQEGTTLKRLLSNILIKEVKNAEKV